MNNGLTPASGAARTPGPDTGRGDREGRPEGACFAAPLPAVDRIETVSMEPTVRFRAYKRVDSRDPYMNGHFPGLTLLPATFFLEALRQSMNTVVGPAEPLNLLEVVAGRWLSPVLSGEVLCLDVEAVPEGPDRWTVRARGTHRDGTAVGTVRAVVGDAGGAHGLDGIDRPPRITDGSETPDYAGMVDMLPVAHPTVLVDRVEAIEPGRRIKVSKAVTGSELCYRSMRPGLANSRYMYPRSLLLESFGQAAALLWLSGAPVDGVRMAASVRDCRFAGQVHPGAVLHHVARIDRLIADDVFVSGQTWDGDRCVLSVGMMATVTRPRSVVTAEPAPLG
ncbi:hypothetical protein [Streptomyces sp. NPDC057496]|uniref:hypothetical protein n=1 Tax=Streptomyces sp. NPDC057496 TaxID=3346149 RepID=UPI0036C46946